MLDALKLTKFRKRSKSKLTSIIFDKIHVKDVTYLPLPFDGDVIVILPPLSVETPDTYGKGMDGMG